MVYPIRFFDYHDIWIKLIYALVVAASSFLIYFRTKELYELSSHKGIKYFRNTFLYFGITYILRSLLYLVITLRFNFSLSRSFTFGVSEIIFFGMVYSSSMALIYLLYSIFWKKLNKPLRNKIYLFHIIALVIAFFSIINRARFLFLIFQSILFVILIIISYLNQRKTKHKESFSQLYLMYLLIFALWIVTNLIEFIVDLSPIIGLITYALSVLSFVIILFKVLRKVNYRK